MTNKKRAAWLKERPSDMPDEAKPILLAVALSFIWFTFISPFVLSGTGDKLLPTPVELGTATVSECSPVRFSIPATWSCDAVVAWQGGTRTREKVLSRDDISSSFASVERRRLRSGRDTRTERLSGSTRVVTAGFPSNSGAGVVTVTAVNLGVVLLIWVPCGLWITHVMPYLERRRRWGSARKK